MFDLDKLDQYYSMNYRVIDVDDSLVDEDHDLLLLKQRYADSVQESVHADNSPERNKYERHDITQWDFGQLENFIEYQHQGMTIRAYPSLAKQSDDKLSLIVCEHQSVAQYQTSIGLLLLAEKVLSNGAQRQGAKYLQKELMSDKQKKQTSKNQLSNLALQLKSVSVKSSNKKSWVNEIMLAGIKQSCFADTDFNSIRNQDTFTQACLLYTSPSPRDAKLSRMPSSA